MKKLCLMLPVLLVLPNCALIVEGTTQDITVSTEPKAATCDFYREGQKIGSVEPTPGSMLVKKNKHDIDIQCNKSGFGTANYHNKSDLAGATFGNIILGGLIGLVVDLATGAHNKYENPVYLTLAEGGEVSTVSAPIAPVEEMEVAPQEDAQPVEAMESPVPRTSSLPLTTETYDYRLN